MRVYFLRFNAEKENNPVSEEDWVAIDKAIGHHYFKNRS